MKSSIDTVDKSDFINRHLVRASLVIAILAALYVRWLNRDFVSDDYKYAVKAWMDTIAQTGPWWSLALPIGNYNTPYMYALSLVAALPIPPLYGIKGLAIAGDMAGAYLVFKIAKQLSLGHQRADYIAAAATTAYLFLPTVFMNGAVWGQSDILYVIFLLASFHSVLVGRPRMSLVFFAISVSVKLQAVFFVPIIFILFFRSGFYRARDFALVPAVFAACWIPALVAGRPLGDVATIYFRQVGFFHDLTLNLPNLYALFPNQFDVFSAWGTCLAMAGVFVVLIAMIANRYVVNRRNFTILCVWVLAFMPFVLPSMHERYAFAGDIFSLLLCVQMPKYLYVAVTMNLISTVSYFPFLFRAQTVPANIVGLIYAAMLVLLTGYLWRELRESNEDPEAKPLGRGRPLLA